MKDDPLIAPPEQEAVPLRWLGVCLTFRVFAYVLLYLACFRFDVPRIAPFVRGVTGFLFPLTLVASPFWVPFAAGFVGACFWLHPEEKAYIRTNWLCAWLFFVGGVVMVMVAGFWFAICIAPFCLCFDVVGSVYGGDLGRKFWNGRLGRQFLGDFSTDDWKDDSK